MPYQNYPVTVYENLREMYHGAAERFGDKTLFYEKKNGFSDIDEKTKFERLARLNEKNREACIRSNEKFVGRTLEILVESFEEKNGDIILAGRAENNKIVHFKGTKELVGEFVDVKITSASTWHLRGELK